MTSNYRLVILVILAAILLGSCWLAGSTDRDVGSNNVPTAIPGENSAQRWVGIAWHTLAVFGDDLSEPVLSRLPETDDSYTAVFDFAVTPDGYIWYPLSRFDFTGNKLIRIDPLDLSVEALVIDLGDKPPSPFNVIADDEWLYILLKYSLTESELMRIALDDPERRETLTLPYDGGGLGSVMELASTQRGDLLALRLFEAVSIVDRDSFTVIDSIKDRRLFGPIVYSPSQRALIMLVMTPPGGSSRSMTPNFPTDTTGLKVSILPGLAIDEFAIVQPPSEYLDQHGVFLSTGTCDLDRTGDLAVALIGFGDKLAVLDLRTNEWTSIHILPADQILGAVVNLGDDRFAIGGNLIYDLNTDKLVVPEGKLFTEFLQMKPLPNRSSSS